MNVKRYNIELSDAMHPALVEEKTYDCLSLAHHGCRDVADMLNTCCRLDRSAEERVLMAAFNVKMETIGIFEISHGTVDKSLLSPREIFIRALLVGAKYIIIAHNHPSGDPSPSADDDRCCRVIERAGRLLGVPMIDFIILGRGDVFGYLENGRIGSGEASE